MGKFGENEVLPEKQLIANKSITKFTSNNNIFFIIYLYILNTVHNSQLIDVIIILSSNY